MWSTGDRKKRRRFSLPTNQFSPTILSPGLQLLSSSFAVWPVWKDGPPTCSSHRQWNWIHKNGVLFSALFVRCLANMKEHRFAGNDAPSFVFPTAIASRQSPGTPSNRPSLPSKPSFLGSGGAGSSIASQLGQKRGTEDLDFFIGDEAIQANAGAGYGIDYPIKHGIISDWSLMERYHKLGITG
jgi:hypothetical protein